MKTPQNHGARTVPDFRPPGRPKGGTAPKGEAINQRNVQPVVCKGFTGDVRYSVDEAEPVFSGLGIGRYLS